MRDSATRFLASRPGIILVGTLIGVLATLLQKLGNPPNMGICVACFERDIAGALGLHRAAVVQYLRPEIPAFILGSFLAALLFREFRSRTGSSPIVRFFLGGFAMVGALAFLGCPWRALLRLAGGDLNAVIGLAGLAIGIAIGVAFLRGGYSLGRTHPGKPVGWIMPAVMVALLILLLSHSSLLFFSEKGPGAMHAPALISIGAALLIGALAQRTRFCTMGSVRDVILMRDTHLLSGVAALVLAAFAMNLLLGQVGWGFSAQPISHSNHVWNLLGMVLAGLGFALAGGCPGRQLFLAGEGDGDASVFVLGMVTGAAFAHNWALAGVPDKVVDGVLRVGGPVPNGQLAVLIGIVFCVVIGFTMREKLEV